MRPDHLNSRSPMLPRRDSSWKKHLGLRRTGTGEDNGHLAQLRGDNGLYVTLMKLGKESAVSCSFHIGFIEESEAQVDEVYQRVKADGFDVPPPRRFHGSWIFYVRAPSGFTIEVLTQTQQSKPSYKETNTRYPTIVEQFKSEGA